MTLRTKHQIREDYKKLRANLQPDTAEAWSFEIANRLLDLPIWEKTYYHVFLSIQRQREIDTEPILALLQGKDKQVVIAKSDFTDLEMHHYLLEDNTRIQLNSYGIPEPINGTPLDVEKIDVVFVPLLAFDTSGHRVGYGKGFYDRFLGKCRPDTIKIGLSFFEASQTWSDRNPSDIPLDYCVTPERIYDFRVEKL